MKAMKMVKYGENMAINEENIWRRKHLLAVAASIKACGEKLKAKANCMALTMKA
jgi:hypothetical protein